MLFASSGMAVVESGCAGLNWCQGRDEEGRRWMKRVREMENELEREGEQSFIQTSSSLAVRPSTRLN